MRVAWLALIMLWAAQVEAQEASYLLIGGQTPVNVVANGYVQSVTDDADGRLHVEVATALAPVGSVGSYGALAAGPGVGVPAGFVIPTRLRDELRPGLSAWEAATRILEWSARHVTVDSTDEKAQDAVSVLARGRGRCSGVANATVALLMAAGFEATTISGLLITDQGQIPHRWLACRLPGAGWVHTDPTLGLWTVTPNHLAFADAVVDPPEVRVVNRGRSPIDWLPRRRGRPLRPNIGSELVCRVVGNPQPTNAVAILLGHGGNVHRVILNPEGRFTAVLPGRWRLVVKSGDAVIEQRDVVLRSGQIHSYTVTVPTELPSREVGS